MQWLKDWWPAVGLFVMALSTVGLLFRDYTKKTITKADDKAGDIVGYWAGFIRFVVGVLRGKK